MFEPIKIQHPLLDDLPLTPTKDELIQLIHLTRLGDTTAKEKLITHLMLVAKCCLSTILTIYPEHRNELDDMVSEAVLAIVEIVNDIIKGKEIKKLSGYISVVILQRVNEMLLKNLGLSISSRSHRRKLKVNEVLEKLPEKIMSDMPILVDTVVEIKDTLDNIVSTPIEKKIIELREAGYNDSDIGEVLELSRSTIQLLRFNLYQRYLEAIQ